MTSVNSPIDRSALWLARVEWLVQQNLETAVTLAYNDRSVGIARIRHDLRAIQTHVDHRLLGSRFHLRPASRRTRIFAFVEGLGFHPHLHLAVRFPADRPVNEGVDHLIAVWSKLAPRGSQVVETITDEIGWASYITKEADPDSEWFCSDDWLSEHSLRAA